MQRRDFMKGIGGSVAAWPLPALAQGGAQRKIAILALGTPTNPIYKSNMTAFMEGLRDLGWLDGQKVHIDLRWGSGNTPRHAALPSALRRLEWFSERQRSN